MFIGRNEELEDLETLWRKQTSSIVACRGRRRIGKSTLFREFAKRTADAYIEIEGLPPQEDSGCFDAIIPARKLLNTARP